MDVVLGEIEDDAKDGGDMNVVEILGKLAHELKCRESVSRDCGLDTRGRTNLASPADVESLGVDPEEDVLLKYAVVSGTAAVHLRKFDARGS